MSLQTLAGVAAGLTATSYDIDPGSTRFGGSVFSNTSSVYACFVPTAFVMGATWQKAAEPDYRRRFSERLSRLIGLPENWSTYGSSKVNPRVAEEAVGLVEVIAPYLRNNWPQVVPTQIGGLQLEWHFPKGVVELEISPNGSRELYIVDLETGGEVEGDLRDNLGPFVSALANFSRV